MFKQSKGKKTLILSLGALLLAAPIPATAHADDSPPPNQNSEVTGAIDVAKGVVQELEDELAKHVSQTSFDASDYKAWNAQFRAKLDLQTAQFEDSLQAQIALPLQPLVAQYQEILQDTSLRPDQVSALKAVQIEKLRQEAQGLTAAYQSIYNSLMKGVLGFLPVPSFQFTGETENSHALKNFGTVMFDIFTLGIGMDFSHEIPAIRMANYTYAVNSLDGSAKPLTGNVGIAALDFVSPSDGVNGSLTVADLDQSYNGGVLNACVGGVDSTDGAKSFDDPKGYEEQVSGALAHSTCNALAVIDAEASPQAKSSSIVFDSFIAKTVKDGCQSQVCLALKEADLQLTLNTLVQKLGQPFQFQFSDGAKVSVAAPTSDISAYTTYLAVPVTDSSLPFDTKAQ